MTFQMVDRNQRLARSHRERFGRHQPDHHPADQSRTGGCCNRIDIIQRHACIGQSSFNQRHHQFAVRARRNFRHDAAKCAVMVLLPGKRMAQNRAVRPDNSRRRFVAT